MADTLTVYVGLLVGGALGQFTFYLGWAVAVLAAVCGFTKRSWLTVQALTLLGALVAKFHFAGVTLEPPINDLAGNYVFNVCVYFVIVSLAYALGWIVMRVLRKDADTAD